MFSGFLIERFSSQTEHAAVISPGASCSFDQLQGLHRQWSGRLAGMGVTPGAVVGLEADFSPASIALLLALLDRRAIIVPFQRGAARRAQTDKEEIAQVETLLRIDATDEVSLEHTGRTASHSHYDELRRRDHPGLVMFSSGTSGEPKAAVHDFLPLLEKFATPRPALSTVAFLLFDHLGGLNTALHALSNAATVVTTNGSRSPDSVCQAVEKHRVQLLPATPTFFNLMLLSGSHRRHDMSSLDVISYGAEPMPAGTLERLRSEFPGVTLQQTYGLIEVGAMRTQSRRDDSLWVRVGGEGYETRVVDGQLQIRSRSMIIGYLNAPLPLTADGWLMTGDAVLQDGEYLKFLGRRSELINVGGEKVYPAEVENVIQSLDCVESAAVYGEPSRLVGHIVCARVKPRVPIDPDVLARQVKSLCRKRLDRFKVPVKVELVEERPVSERFKTLRRGGSPA